MSTKLHYDEDLCRKVRQTMLFGELNDDDFQQICDHARMVEVEDSGLLFEHGQEATEFFFLLSGQMKLTRLSVDGNEKVIDIIRPNQTFAEAAMFLGAGGYPVNAQAVGACRVLCFNAGQYLTCLRDSVDACLALIGRMSQRLHFQLNEIDRLTLHSATYRLVSYLLEQAPRGERRSELKLGIPKHVIASRLSIKPETLSRILGRLNQSGLIEVHDSQIILSDTEALREHIHLGTL